MATFHTASRRITANLATSDEHQSIRISAYFFNAGINYLNGKNDPKGYWISVEPIEVRDNFDISRPFSRGSRHFVEATTRYSAKRLEQIWKDAKSQPWFIDMVKLACEQAGVTVEGLN